MVSTGSSEKDDLVRFRVKDGRDDRDIREVTVAVQRSVRRAHERNVAKHSRSTGMRRVGHQNVAVLEVLSVEFHLILDSANQEVV